ncbi:MAG TPA: hypothetical protein DDZ37_01180 [Spirochaetaceae bacterium]|nr:hypothetical protein [Spirochaetaceae bacterium]
MKRAILVLVLAAFVCGSVFSESGKNLQKIYPIDSDIYQAITALYISQGLALPSTTGPWSADELLEMLEKIDTGKLSGGTLAAYQYASSELNRDTTTFKFGLSAAMEAYNHTNTTDFTDESDWVVGFAERKPLLDISLEAWPGEHFYGYSSMSVGNNCYNGWNATDGYTSTLFGQYALTTNIPLVPPAVMSDLDFNVPYRAFGAFGGDGWSAEFGRERLSWGPGESGNFVIGDQILYHNMGRITTYTKNFKYTFLTSFFPYPDNYYPIIDKTTGNYTGNGRSQSALVSGIKMFMAHRLEWNMFKDKVGFILTEGIMYQSADNTLDLRILNPAMIFHDYYIRGNANSILSAELNFTPIPYVNLYGQVVVDEFALPGEPMPGESGALPAAFGYMAGAKGRYPFGKGMFFGFFEWARTDPYLYLRDGSSYSQSLGDPGLNYVVALRMFSNAGGISYTEEFMGYEYGGDAIVYNANLGYKQFGKWYVSANFFFMEHGTFDKWTCWTDVSDASDDVSTPTTIHVTDNNGDLDTSDRNAVAYTTIVGLKGGYTIMRNFDVYLEADYIYIKNPDNVSANAPIRDFQLTASISYSL